MRRATQEKGGASRRGKTNNYAQKHKAKQTTHADKTQQSERKQSQEG
jgi:hypothetical protein